MKITKDIIISLQGIEFSAMSFKDKNEEAFCLYRGNSNTFAECDVLVRIHSGCITSEVFGMSNCDCKWQLDNALKLIGNSTAGVLIYLPGQEGKGNGLFNKIRSFDVMELGIPSIDAYEMINLPSDVRNYDFPIRILKTLGIKQIKLITNSPAKVMACLDGGLTISERIPVIINNPNPTVRRLLENKKIKFDHYID